MSAVIVEPVRGQRQLREFIRLPWAIYKNDPNWVPPLQYMVKRLLDPRRHPFWQSARRELFVAHINGEPVGRIAALVDERWQSYRSNNDAAWGFFECRHNPQAAALLFDRAEKWAAGQGADLIIGPFNPSTNYEVGLLVKGFDTPPALMMTYNPPYYADLATLSGYEKHKDLLAFRLESGYEIPAWGRPILERIKKNSRISFQFMDTSRLDQQINEMSAIYEECWADNWGFVPMMPAEIKESASLLVRLADPELGFFMLQGDEKVGVCLLLPDINQLFKRLNGKLGISGLYKYLMHRKKITALRGLLFGTTSKVRNKGLPAIAFEYVVNILARKPQYRHVEMGWTLEENQSINDLFIKAGLEPCKRWRIYAKALASS